MPWNDARVRLALSGPCHWYVPAVAGGSHGRPGTVPRAPADARVYGVRVAVGVATGDTAGVPVGDAPGVEVTVALGVTGADWRALE